MVIFTTNQRISHNWNGSDWIEEVLAASGVEVSSANFSAISGGNAQISLDSIDNVLAGINYSAASGIVMIEDVSNVSGVTSSTLQNLDTITLGSGSNSSFKFSFSVPAQPVDPINLRLLFAGAGASASGTFSGTLEYNLFDQGDDLTNGSYTYTGTAYSTLVSGDFEELKLLTFTIPLVNFSSGSAPFIFDGKLTRDVSVSGNYDSDIKVAQLYADNVPGGILGQSAGYLGGNLVVTGDLTITGKTVLAGGTVPASGTATGTSGTVVVSDDFLYVAVSGNYWKRAALADF